MGRLREILERLAKTVQIRHVLVRQGLAECLGTLVLVVSAQILSFFFSESIVPSCRIQDFMAREIESGTRSAKSFYVLEVTWNFETVARERSEKEFQKEFGISKMLPRF